MGFKESIRQFSGYLNSAQEMLQAAAPMLEVQFGQASDFGKVRTNNEDAMGRSFPLRASRPALTAICSRLPTAWAAWTWAKWPRPRPSQP
jgi:hypothetical protein